MLHHICKGCGVEFARKGRRSRFCSQACFHTYASGANHGRYKGGKISNGYHQVFVDGHWRLEHRLIMEAHLGRPLRTEEHVHHKDHNKLNNSLDNLQLVANTIEHNHLHRTLVRTATHKECSRCHEVKPRTEFNRQKTQPNCDPNVAYCRPCQAVYAKQWYQRHKVLQD